MKVTGFGNFAGFFEEFFLKKNFNAHSECKFRISVKDEEAAAYLEKVGKSFGVMLETENPAPVFFGEIKSVTMERMVSRTCVEVYAIGDSAKIDEEKHSRIFQNPEKTFSDVLNISRLKLKKCELSLAPELAKEKYKNIILQNQETDFEFMKRLAKYARLKIWINDTKQGQIVLKIADCMEKSVCKVDRKKIISCRMGREKNFKSARLVTEEYLSLGSLIQIGNDSCKYLINSLELRMIHGTDKFFYELEEYLPKKIEINPVPLEKTVKLKAHVTKVNDEKNFGRLQVQVDDAEDEDKEKFWFPYRTPYSGKEGGIVFLPDEKDAVELIFSNGEVFVCSALRANPLQKECQNVRDKYIGNNTEQRIFWKEKSLEIISVKNKIYLDKDKIELTVGENKILIENKGITLQTKKNKILLNDSGIETQTEENFKVKSNKESGIDAGSKLKLLAKDSANLQGKSVTAKATGGDVNISGSSVKLS